MEFELPKINVSFEYDEEKDEIVFVINGVEKRVKTADMITEMEKLQEQNTALEQEPCEDCISRAEAINAISHAELSFQVESDLNFENYKREVQEIADGILKGQVKAISDLPSIQPKPKTGHWIIKEGREQGYDIAGIKTWYIQIMCDKCGFIKTAIEGHTGQYHFCPNCGTKMEKRGKGMTNEEAIKMLKSKMDGHTDTSYEWAETVRMAIKVLEQEPKWIPVSERLPEEETDVLICNKQGEIEISQGSRSTEVDAFIWYTSGWRFGEVIAWMPLPEPYKAESEVMK